MNSNFLSWWNRSWRQVSLFLVAWSLTNGFAVRAESIQYNRDVRPILTDQCFACHGPDNHARKGDLRLDVRDDAISSGAIVPGKANESEFVRRILSIDPDEIMPPPDSHKKLTAEQRSILQKWIESGAEYQTHWSFVAPKSPTLPTVNNKAWVRNSIDRFVLAKLEEKGLTPNPEADIRTLVRRACLDITGLPPSPEELKAVVEDTASDRYERYVDGLLQRPTWGEHRARYWMDYARYGDTHGIHFDNYREMYSYRDWVIEAFNRNVPFDQFTIEQLAGDLLPNADRLQKIATGFNRCNITTNEGGIIDEEYAVLYARDRVETTFAVWMGMTIGCAVCHDHKFDPISQKEFYQLAAFFNNTTQPVRDGNIKNTPPTIPVPAPEEVDRYDALVSEQASLTKFMDAHRRKNQKKYDAWIKAGNSVRNDLLSTIDSFPEPSFHVPLALSDNRILTAKVGSKLVNLPLEKSARLIDGQVGSKAWTIQSDLRPSFEGIANFERDQPFTISFWLRPEGDKSNGSIVGCIDEAQDFRGWEIAFANGKLVVQLLHQGGKDLLKFLSDKPLTPNTWHELSVVYQGTSKGTGLTVFVDDKPLAGKITNDTLTGSIQGTGQLRLGGRSKGTIAEKVGIQDLKIFDKAVTIDVISQMNAHARVAFLASKETRSANEEKEINKWYFENLDETYKKMNARWFVGERERASIEARGTIAHVMSEKPDAPIAYVLRRGEYDKRGEEVTPNTPAIFAPMPEEYPRNRLGFARWLVMAEHPLMARVTVNRFWQEVFGQGIVSSTGDFGLSGAVPTNQDLLDYLAVDFRSNGWNVKELFRQMLTSATYRQSAATPPEKLSIDPNNALLSRGPRFRLDGEAIRDYALKVSGLLSPRIGGKSVRPYQPVGVWEAVAMPNSDTKAYKEDQGDGLYRRSLYTFWKRAAPPASMDIFNAPTREVCTVRRERTNTALQALVTLNDPQFIEAARHLAERSLHETNLDDAGRIQWLASVVLSRPMKATELEVLQSGLVAFRQHYSSNSDDAKSLLSVGASPRDQKLEHVEHAVWTMVAHQLLNLDEALCK